MFERRRELALEMTLKGHEMLRLYRETGNEMYKILAEYYLDTDDLLGPSKLFSNVSIEQKSAPFEILYTK